MTVGRIVSSANQGVLAKQAGRAQQQAAERWPLATARLQPQRAGEKQLSFVAATAAALTLHFGTGSCAAAVPASVAAAEEASATIPLRRSVVEEVLSRRLADRLAALSDRQLAELLESVLQDDTLFPSDLLRGPGPATATATQQMRQPLLPPVPPPQPQLQSQEAGDVSLFGLQLGQLDRSGSLAGPASIRGQGLSGGHDNSSSSSSGGGSHVLGDSIAPEPSDSIVSQMPGGGTGVHMGVDALAQTGQEMDTDEEALNLTGRLLRSFLHLTGGSDAGVEPGTSAAADGAADGAAASQRTAPDAVAPAGVAGLQFDSRGLGGLTELAASNWRLALLAGTVPPLLIAALTQLAGGTAGQPQQQQQQQSGSPSAADRVPDQPPPGDGSAASTATDTLAATASGQQQPAVQDGAVPPDALPTPPPPPPPIPGFKQQPQGVIQSPQLGAAAAWEGEVSAAAAAGPMQAQPAGQGTVLWRRKEPQLRAVSSTTASSFNGAGSGAFDGSGSTSDAAASEGRVLWRRSSAGSVAPSSSSIAVPDAAHLPERAVVYSASRPESADVVDWWRVPLAQLRGTAGPDPWADVHTPDAPAAAGRAAATGEAVEAAAQAAGEQSVETSTAAAAGSDTSRLVAARQLVPAHPLHPAASAGQALDAAGSEDDAASAGWATDVAWKQQRLLQQQHPQLQPRAWASPGTLGMDGPVAAAGVPLPTSLALDGSTELPQRMPRSAAPPAGVATVAALPRRSAGVLDNAEPVGWLGRLPRGSRRHVSTLQAGD